MHFFPHASAIGVVVHLVMQDMTCLQPLLPAQALCWAGHFDLRHLIALGRFTLGAAFFFNFFGAFFLAAFFLAAFFLPFLLALAGFFLGDAWVNPSDSSQGLSSWRSSTRTSSWWRWWRPCVRSHLRWSLFKAAIVFGPLYCALEAHRRRRERFFTYRANRRLPRLSAFLTACCLYHAAR